MMVITGRQFILQLHKILRSPDCNYLKIKKLLTHIDNNLLNSKDANSGTALHLAINKDQSLEVIHALLESGANPFIGDKKGNTALHLLLITKLQTDTKLMEVLLTNGCEVNARNNNLETPLHIATLYQRPNVLEFLIQNGANIELLNRDGESPLKVAIGRSDITIVQRLLNLGANVNTCTRLWRSPLHEAVENNDFDIIQCLLSHQAQVNFTDLAHDTPLHLAMHCDVKIVRELIIYGANANIRNNNNISPLEQAEKLYLDRPELIEAIIKYSLFMTPEFDYYSVQKSTKMISAHVYACQNELSKMFQSYVDESHSLYDFVRERMYKHPRKDVNHIQTQNLFKLTSKFKYKNYNNFIFSMIPRQKLINEFCSIPIFAKTAEKCKKIYLSEDLKMIIANFMPFLDLINVIKAYYIGCS